MGLNVVHRKSRIAAIALLPVLAIMPMASLQAACAYGEDQCLSGFVWRDAFAGDHVCVSGDVRTQAQQDNDRAPGNHLPSSELCRPGLVWREAEPDDHVCVSGTTRAQAAADNAAASARRDPVCKEPVGPHTVDTLTLNFAGTGGGMGPDSEGVRFEERARRLAIWARRNRVTPDLIALQEIYGWLYTPPVRSCGRGFGAGVGDYDEVDALLKAFADMTGVTYRVAYLTGRVSSFGALACNMYAGQAVLYNPARLVNVTPSQGSVAHDAEDGLAGTPHQRRSLPLCNRGSRLMPLERLIDGPPQNDKCGPTPSGEADAVFTAHGHLAGTHARFELIGRPGFIDVFNLHPTSGLEETDKTAIQKLIAAHVPPPLNGLARQRLIPPLILGDLNGLDIERDFPQFRTVMNIPGDVGRVGIANETEFPTYLRARATRRLIVPDMPAGAPEDSPCRPGLQRYLVSDHCGLFARFDADAPGAAELRGVFIDGPSVVSAGERFVLVAVPSGGKQDGLDFKWSPSGANGLVAHGTAGAPSTTALWSVDVTERDTGRTVTGRLSIRTRSEPNPCAQACQPGLRQCLADRTHPGWPSPQWCREQYRVCIDACSPQ